MPRPDVSDKLIHFTSGRDEASAFRNLCSIIDDQAIRGGFGKIRGGYQCVCFTEAPLAALARGLVNLSDYSKYQPFGVMYDKTHVFAQGGRPVIYQSEPEYLDLPEGMRWRHMRYEPIAIPPAEKTTDFTWEREWRVQCELFSAAPHVAALLLPTFAWANQLLQLYDERQDLVVAEYAQVMDTLLAEQYREMFPWRIFVLEGGI